MTILVIGGSGFLGRALVMRLNSLGKQVIATSRSPATRFKLDGVRWHDLTLSELANLEALLDGVSLVYHLGWSTIPSTAHAGPVDDFKKNVVGSVRLLESLCHRRGVRLVFASSGGAVYGKIRKCPVIEDYPLIPCSVYGRSKAIVEKFIDLYAAVYGLDAVTLRFSNPFGADQLSARTFGAVTTLCAQALRGDQITIFGDGSAVRDFFYVDDAVDALVLAGSAEVRHRHINIGSEIGISLNQLVDTIARAANRRLKVIYKSPRDFDLPISVLNISRARKELRWQPKTTFAQGLALTLDGLCHKIGCEWRR